MGLYTAIVVAPKTINFGAINMHPDYERKEAVNQACIGSVCREKAAEMLRRRARHLHEKAVRLEKLAAMSEGLPEDIDVALYELASSTPM